MQIRPRGPALPAPFAIVGAGRLGSAIAGALHAAGIAITGPHGRGYPGRAEDGTPDAVVLLCVPDDAITEAASWVVPGPLLGHCSGVSTLDVLGDREGFSVHPLLTVTGPGTSFRDAWAAVAGTTARAIDVAEQLARALGLQSVRVADADRAAYHAAASIAANFLVTLESAAAQLLATAGLDRAVLLPLARAALENWGSLGPAALTGPVARGDVGTVDRHRAVVRARTPQHAELFEVLVAATERLVVDPQGAAATDGPPSSSPPTRRQPTPKKRRLQHPSAA